MSKREKHWCDDLHNKSETHFVIGEMADGIYNDLEKYLLNDLQKYIDTCNSELMKSHILKRFHTMLDVAELMVLNVKDANSIFAVYACDYEARRERWLNARGYSFRLVSQLDHMANIVAAKTNIQKYAGISKRLYELSAKIKNIMKSDDKKKKTQCKEYFPS